MTDLARSSIAWSGMESCRIHRFGLDYPVKTYRNRSTDMTNERTEVLEAPELVLGALYLGGLVSLIAWFAA